MWRTILLVYVVMEGAGGIVGAVGGSGEAEEMQGASQDDIFHSQFCSDNRFQSFAEGVGYPTNVSDSDTEWRKQSRKRKRNETGSVDLDAFTKMSPDEKLIALFTKLMTMEDKQNILRSVMSPVHEKVDILEDCVNIHERKIKMLSYRSLDLEARSRRNNLIFRGLADVAGENCTDIIVDFLSEEMAMEISPIVIARAHRLGSLQRFRSRQHVSRRPIIVAFKDYSLTEQIMTNARRLRGTNFRVEKDFPAEIAEARKNLWPKLKAEKSKDPTCRVTIAYPAKLIRNNRVIADEFPDWYQVLRLSRVQGFEPAGPGVDKEYENSRGRDKRVFRPWQPREDPGINTQIQVDSDSESGESVIGPTQSDTSSRDKLFTKQNMNENFSNEPRMTEQVKLAKDNKSKNTIAFQKSTHKEVIPPKSNLKSNLQNESRSRSHSLTDTSRGRSVSRSNTARGAAKGNRDEPMSNANSAHMTHDVAVEGNRNNASTSQDTTQRPTRA